MKSKYTFKTITAIITIAFTTIFISSCIPTGGGTTPTPSNQFVINISDQNITSINNIPGQETVAKKVLVDGDSIEFSFTIYSVNMCGDCEERLQIKFENSITNYEELVRNTTPDQIATVATGIAIPSDIDTSYHWVSLNTNIYSKTTRTILGRPIFGDVSTYGTDDRYLIFRKLMGSNYQYYWVKLKYSNGIYRYLTISTGKYQLNSIITGQ